MSEKKISNEILYELLQEFKKDMNHRLDGQEKNTNRRFDEQERRNDRMEDHQREDHHMLMDIWKSREIVHVKMTWDFLWKAVGINAALFFFMFFVLDKSV